MLKLADGVKIFVSLKPEDMRKSINGLTVLVTEIFETSPQSRHLFLFYNKKKDKVKIVFWDRNGFVLCYKRLDKGRFKLTPTKTANTLIITDKALAWLLAGLDFQLMQTFNELDYEDYY